jgi:hypothetical protein
MSYWREVRKHELPPEDVVVMTMIYDQDGRRNERPLKRKGTLWFQPDNSSYVYYTPTHWTPLSAPSATSCKKEAR